MAIKPTTAPAQPMPLRILMPLVALNVGTLESYLQASFDYAESILQSVNSDERSVMKDAITAGRTALQQAAKARKDAPLVTDSKAIQEQSKPLADAFQNLNFAAEIVMKHFNTGTMLNDRLIAKIVVNSRTAARRNYRV